MHSLPMCMQTKNATTAELESFSRVASKDSGKRKAYKPVGLG